MAIQFARTSYVSRYSGGNACLKSSYNERSIVFCERTGENFNFLSRGGNVHHAILLPENVNTVFKDSTYLWNAAEHIEKRKNSQVAKEAVLALPDDSEITLAHRIEMTESFVTSHFVDKGLAAQIDIHEPHEGEKNWHAHILVTTRRFKESGDEFGEKARDLNQQIRKGQVVEGWDIGEAWKDHQNAFFVEKNIDLRVDPIGIVPQEHLGPVRMRVHMNEALERANLLQEANEEASRDPEKILKRLTRNQSVFCEKDIDQYLNKHVDGDGRTEIKKAVLAHENILSLYDRETGKATSYFTIKEVREEEEELLKLVEKVNDSNGKHISQKISKGVIEGKRLYKEQETAVMYALQVDKGLSIIEGKAGTGKSYTMQAIREVYEQSDYRVIGLSPTNQVAQDMKKDGFIESYTVHSFLFQHKNNRIPVTSDTVFIVDEAAMISTPSLAEFFKVAKEIKGKVILFGDDRQLASVERGGMFRTLIGKVGSCELFAVLRQQGWQKEVSELLAKERTGEAVKKLSDQGALHWDATKEESMTSLIQKWREDQVYDRDKSQLILAKKNVDVDAINKATREIRLREREISPKGYEYQTARGKECFSQKDRVCFTQTDKKLGIANGVFGEIRELSDTHCLVRLDNGNSVSFNPEIYHGMKLGYASTVYKAQGKTIDRVYVLHDKGTNNHLSYVALTRQSSQLKIFVHKEETKSLSHFNQQMSRKDIRVPSLNFAISEEVRETQQQEQDLSQAGPLKRLWQDLKQFTKKNLGDTFFANKDFYSRQEKTFDHTVVSVDEKLDQSSLRSIVQGDKTHDIFQQTEVEKLPLSGIYVKDQPQHVQSVLSEEEKVALSGGLSQRHENKSFNTALTDEEKLLLSGRQKIKGQPYNQEKDQYSIQQDDLSKGNHISRKGPSFRK